MRIKTKAVAVAALAAYVNGISVVRAAPIIVLPQASTAVERSAATELAEGVEKMLGARPAVVSEKSAAAGAPRLYIGATAVSARLRGGAAWKTDEILVKSVADGVVLDGDPKRAPIYAVVEYLERFCGVRWWTSTESDYPKLRELPTANLDRSFAPPFIYRETYYLDGYDWRFKVRNRGNFTSKTRYMLTDLPRIPKAWGGDHTLYYYKGRRSAYHSFFEILPGEKYFKDHPEWFAYRDGARKAFVWTPDGRRHRTQLCLSNEEMKKEYIRETIRRLGESPDVDFISVTQNDCHGHCDCWCTCPACEKLMADDDGRPTGLYLSFANDVAAALEKVYPDITVDTFAYEFTCPVPKKVRPRRNVTVRLCSYACDFSTPLVEERYPVNATFARQLREWNRAAPGQIIVWDYTTLYPNYVLPHPNIHPIAANIRFFRDCGSAGVYSLGDALSSVSSFGALHHYLNAHLLWDPDMDGRRLVEEFAVGYYGKAAAPFILAHIELLEATAVAKDFPVLCCYERTGKFITPDEALSLSSLMRAARTAAAGESPVFARRVRREELSVDQLFILNWAAYKARAQETGVPWIRPATRLAAVEEWERALKDYGAVAYRETVDASDLPDYISKLKKECKQGGIDAR